MKEFVKKIKPLKRLYHLCRRYLYTNVLTSADFWSDYNVSGHHHFTTAEESLEYFHWRNKQYFNYIELMPVSGFDDKVILDFGCGPGNDLVGFGVYSKPRKLIGMDVSTTSMAEAKKRLLLHDIQCDLILINEKNPRLPMDSSSIDYIHSSGVLHHLPDPVVVLKEFHRILKRDGTCRVMVYNYNSLWLHLHVAYQLMLREGRFQNLDIRDAFSRTTDSESCPIAKVYRPEEFVLLASSVGLDCEFTGAAIQMSEAAMVKERQEAIMDRRLRSESREFLLELMFDESGFPKYRDHYAGIDGCYLLRRKN
jgi:ubiquinone/menaquinone biosynthesis C-methylase UbiE